MFFVGTQKARIKLSDVSTAWAIVCFFFPYLLLELYTFSHHRVVTSIWMLQSHPFNTILINIFHLKIIFHISILWNKSRLSSLLKLDISTLTLYISLILNSFSLSIDFSTLAFTMFSFSSLDTYSSNLASTNSNLLGHSSILLQGSTFLLRLLPHFMWIPL